MNTDQRTLGQGDVPIVLVDVNGIPQNVVLKPSLHAIRMLSRKYGGLEPLINKLSALDFDVVVDVLSAGMQVPGHNPKAMQELEESAFRTGLSDQTGGLPRACVRFVVILMHGGKPPPQEAQAGAGVDGAQPNPPTVAT